MCNDHLFFSLLIYLLFTLVAVMALEGGKRLSADTMKDLVCSSILEMVPELVQSLRAGHALSEKTNGTLGVCNYHLNRHSDYTHYVKASPGFLDRMLMYTANVDTCPERDKCTVLLLDEMHIYEDLVFIKHMRTIIA